MSKRRLVAMLIVVALVVTGLYGCGNKQDSGESSVAESSPSAGIEQENSSEDSGTMDISEKVELRIMVQTGLDPDTLPMFQKIEEK